MNDKSEKYGHIVHSNRDRKFVIMYVNEQDVDQIVHKLLQLKYVGHIDGSPYKYLKKNLRKEKSLCNPFLSLNTLIK